MLLMLLMLPGRRLVELECRRRCSRLSADRAALQAYPEARGESRESGAW
jgi:hypothetical protein